MIPARGISSASNTMQELVMASCRSLLASNSLTSSSVMCAAVIGRLVLVDIGREREKLLALLRRLFALMGREPRIAAAAFLLGEIDLEPFPALGGARLLGDGLKFRRRQSDDERLVVEEDRVFVVLRKQIAGDRPAGLAVGLHPDELREAMTGGDFLL